ncbi:hypothetical protein C5167_024168 [Papaver somniferum]|uniref:Major facilitator superfamily (MFS) profile domain-containing protein n=1 Tax=Papaver somniferum TaxID=3469 RepID=A0A4Y7JRR7_PAPSO|nr:hypothetical protein C5167_024168 [Papaver somniferum]
MPETARYTALVAKDAKKASAEMSKVLHHEIEITPWLQILVEPEIIVEQEIVETETGNSFGLFSLQFLSRHGLHLLGTSSTWFFLDIAFYSQNLFRKDIYSAVGWIDKPRKMNAIEEVYFIARLQTFIALCSTIPGYWFTVALIDRIGRFWIQLMMTVFMLGLAIRYHHWTQPENGIGFLVMYFFANFGPNSTTFIVPAEIFPSRLRSTCHGISAAAGKAGAVIGAFGFLYLAQDKDPKKADPGYPAGISLKNALIVLGFVNFLGMLCTLLVPESKCKSLEEMSGEKQEETA